MPIEMSWRDGARTAPPSRRGAGEFDIVSNPPTARRRAAMTGVDLAAVRDRLRTFAPVTGVRTLEGGLSSLTYLATTDGGTSFVVKMAPPGLAPVRNRDVLR